MSSDNIIYRTKRTTPISQNKKVKSQPTPIKLKKHDNVVEPHVITSGVYNNTPVIVFGEIHDKIYNNSFYENIELDSSVIMVEHPSILCSISPQEKRLFFNILKGSEWIWYKQAARNKPVICIDNRLELGLPSAIESKLASSITTMSYENIYIISQCVMNFMRVFSKPEIKREFIENNMTPVFMDSMKTIKEQFTEYLKISQEETLGAAHKKQLLELKNALLYNLMKLASVLVDFNIIRHIRTHADGTKPILIFCGVGHTYRLHKFFPEIFPHIEYNVNNKDILSDIKTIVTE